MKDNHIAEIKLETTGFEIDDYSLIDLESELVGALMDKEIIAQKVKQVCNDHLMYEWIKCIYKVKELQLQQTGNG
jgi:hypothetical protein